MDLSKIKVVIKKTDKLIGYVNNSRTHSDSQTSQIASSIKEFGFTNPLLLDEDNGVIAGHGRLLAAKKLELVDVPCIVLKGLTEAQKKAYVIADNQLALNSGWDMEKLTMEIETLQEMDFDVGVLGFDASFFVEEMGGDSGGDDEIPDDNYSEQHAVIVTCESEIEQEQTFEKLTELGYTCKVVSV